MVTKKRLFFDIETSFNIGFFWRSGWKERIPPENIIKERAIICISWKWEGEEEIHHLTWDRNQCDKKMLIEFIQILNTASEIIAHNGDRFDIKWLRTRCLFHRIQMFPAYNTLDTLKVSKSGFNFNSNKLDYIAKYLGVGEKINTGGIDLWKRVILDNNGEALEEMVTYCDQDVRVLEAVFNELNNFIKVKTNFAVAAGGEKFECPECGSVYGRKRKTYHTAMGTPKHNITCKKCSKNYTINNATYMKYLEYKIKNGIK